jgi:hypothetical protein
VYQHGGLVHLRVSSRVCVERRDVREHQ